VAGVFGSHQFITSQEIRLASRDSSAALTWLVGAFYAHVRSNQSDYTYGVTDPLNPGLFGVDDTVDTDTAIFANATLNVSIRWRVGLGARLDRTKADSTVLETGFANPVTVPLHRSVDDAGDSLAPRFVVSYEPQAGGVLYASASKGFRAGGLNVPECGAPPKYAPDFVWSYEMGAKDSAFNNRLQLDGSIFYAKWTDIQQRTSTKSTCFVDYTSNFGEAVSRGFDLTADALLGDRTYIGIAVGYLDAHYTNTIKTGGNVIVEEGTAVGGLPGVPSPWSLIAHAEYRLPLSSSATAYARAEESVRSHNPGPFLEANPESPRFNSTVFADPATNLLNLYLGVRREGLDLRISVLNVLNSQPLLQHDSDAPYSTLQYAFTFRPRTLALSATQRF
jgi:iron complex outermembrane recepter protein